MRGCALRDVLKPDGAMHLMVYAAYGRTGIYMLQEFCRRIGIGLPMKEIRDLATRSKPCRPIIRWSTCCARPPDFRSRQALADALLHPQDRAYSVPQLFDFIERGGLAFGRWVKQAPYLPHCGVLAAMPHASRLAMLPLPEQYAAVELFRGNDGASQPDRVSQGQPGDSHLPRFDGDDWLGYVPMRLPETISVRERLPAGAAAALINRSHSDPDLVLFVDAAELQMIEAIDGRRTIADIIEHVATSKPAIRPTRRQTHRLFQRLWQYDQVVFDLTGQGDNVRP